MRALYAGFDLHGNNNDLGIIDGDGKRVFGKKLSNDIIWIQEVVHPFSGELLGIAVESTYNWYWLVGGLMEAGYRGHWVRLRTSLIISLQNILSRNFGKKVNVNDVKALREDLVLAGGVSKQGIDFFTHQIRRIEGVVDKRIRLKDEYRYLLTIPGVGKILALTIMLETGPIGRFATVGDYVSYCRKVPTQWMSNGRWKGSGNRKNGNKYLAWAYWEASELARRYYPEPRAYYHRKMQKTNAAVAHSALAHKPARSAYYVMRDQVPFQSEKLFR